MLMLYNSDHYAVLQFDVPASAAGAGGFSCSGYEIVDKASGREIFLSGELARHFRKDVQALIESQPAPDEVEAFVARYAGLAQQPVVFH
jgi:hypothetical protein